MTSPRVTPLDTVSSSPSRIEPGKGKCYICGPDGMVEDIADALKDIGVAEDDIIIEEFFD